MPAGPVRRRLRYRFDNFMAGGGRSIFIGLMALFLVIFGVLVAIRLMLVGLIDDPGGRGPAWHGFLTFLQMTDPGSMAEDISAPGWYQALAITAGVLGIVMLAALIAFITTAIDRRLHDLRKGHSEVVEQGHTLILGWDEQRVVEIINELVIANASVPHRAVVVLAAEDKEYMDDYLAISVPYTATTTIVTRSGNPASLVNLDLVAVGTAASVIVLSGCSDSSPAAQQEEADARVVKTLLAVARQREEGPEVAMVTEIFDPAIRSIVTRMGRHGVVALDARDFLSRILVQTSRSVGLSLVYDELLSFRDNEIYLYGADWGSPATFGDLSDRFPQAVPIGIWTASGSLELNPGADRPVGPGDQMVVIAEDDSTISLSEHRAAEEEKRVVPTHRLPRTSERLLIVGHTPKSKIILRELGKYVAPGSRVDVMPRGHHAVAGAEMEAIRGEVHGLHVETLAFDPLAPSTWEAVDPRSYSGIIILSEGDEQRMPDQIDAETILILLLIRGDLDPARAGDGATTTVITELIESENQALASSTGVHDFVISSRMVSMLLAQVSEQPLIHEVYRALLEDEGSEIYLKPTTLYLTELPTRITFAELTRLVRQRDEVCIGVRLKRDEHREDRNCGITLAPRKDSVWDLGPDDSLVVLAEDDT